ncbi:hypothetical protein [Pseudomonas sp. DP-17]|uniref:hypothetical protein n=1 Tax=Pseudomonas sp. DP-17 TaxID=1580486 RepID=UPI001EFA31BD|nr:hypothetical protein [Pseudomonas sp. DP-17]MCG8906715.1 hypothetical protein [Pseudomonas sp. DP-17]
MTKLNRIIFILLANAAQSNPALADQDSQYCDARGVFPSNYRTECKKTEEMTIITAQRNVEKSAYATNLDNIPTTLIVGDKPHFITRRISSSKIYTELFNLPTPNNSSPSSSTARKKIAHPDWKLIDMRTIEYKGANEENGQTLVCLTLLNTKKKTIKALIKCSDFYEEDIQEINNLENNLK